MVIGGIVRGCQRSGSLIIPRAAVEGGARTFFLMRGCRSLAFATSLSSRMPRAELEKPQQIWCPRVDNWAGCLRMRTVAVYNRIQFTTRQALRHRHT